MVQLVSLGLDLNLAMSTSLARVDCDLTKDSTSAVVAGLTVPDRSRDNVPRPAPPMAIAAVLTLQGS
jgi:hypothetical protein